MTLEEAIWNIPRFESSDGKILRLSDKFIRNKLLNALYNRDIICLSRGEGRSTVINDIILHPEILFDWGEKSVHAFLSNKQEELRRFCDPNVVDKESLIYYVKKYSLNLENYYLRYRWNTKEDVEQFMKKLLEEINVENEIEKLLCIKEWLIYALHTMGEPEFKGITSCISCSYGNNRFEVANKFGRGFRQNNYYVILDSWVNITEEGTAYKKMDYVNDVLGQYGLKWFSNKHNEIMLKYAIFPQQLVGYYLWDRNNISKHVLNRHYIEKWNNDSDYEIGQPIYFEQIADFERLGPYNTVYEFNGSRFSIIGRR
ncbi:MAG: hypothetical protein PHF63_11730 [Herbinix sp.]|nr:hypothetical protein [Herbinix sp.]